MLGHVRSFRNAFIYFYNHSIMIEFTMVNIENTED